MKRLLCLLLCAALCAFTLPAPAAAAARGEITLASGRLNVRKSASAKSAIVEKLVKGDRVEVLSRTGERDTDWYRIETPSGRTGYVQRKYVSLLPEEPQTGGEDHPGREEAAEMLPVGDGISPAFPQDELPEGVLDTKEEVVQAISHHMMNFEENFTIYVSNSGYRKLLPTLSEAKFGYLLTSVLARWEGVKPVHYAALRNAGSDYPNALAIDITARYGPAGEVQAYYKLGRALRTQRARELKNKVEEIFEQVVTPGMSAYEKELALHDYLILHCAYDNEVNADPWSYTAYGALVLGKGTCQGYAEALCLLFNLAGLPSEFVRADSVFNEGGTHGFVKVNVGGRWYCVDPTANDPIPDREGRLRHDYFNVTDEVMAQRYTPWWGDLYPSCTSTALNFHVQNGGVVESKEEMVRAVREAAAGRSARLELWTNRYSKAEFGAGVVKAALPDGVSARVYSLGSKLGVARCALYIELEYGSSGG